MAITIAALIYVVVVITIDAVIYICRLFIVYRRRRPCDHVVVALSVPAVLSMGVAKIIIVAVRFTAIC